MNKSVHKDYYRIRDMSIMSENDEFMTFEEGHDNMVTSMVTKGEKPMENKMDLNPENELPKKVEDDVVQQRVEKKRVAKSGKTLPGTSASFATIAPVVQNQSDREDEIKQIARLEQNKRRTIEILFSIKDRFKYSALMESKTRKSTLASISSFLFGLFSELETKTANARYDTQVKFKEIN